MVEKQQAVIEYRTGLFYGDDFADAYRSLLKRYNPNKNARIQLHTCMMLQDGEAVLMGELTYRQTVSVETLRKVVL